MAASEPDYSSAFTGLRAGNLTSPGVGERADNATFFLGMLRWMQTQLGEQYFCRWRIHQHCFIESSDPEFMLDALRCGGRAEESRCSLRPI